MECVPGLPGLMFLDLHGNAISGSIPKRTLSMAWGSVIHLGGLHTRPPHGHCKSLTQNDYQQRTYSEIVILENLRISRVFP